MVGYHYWPDAAALTTPTVTIANVLAIGRTMEDDEAEIIDGKWLGLGVRKQGASWKLIIFYPSRPPIDGRPNPIGPVCLRPRRIGGTIWQAIWLPRSGSR
jgi:hypothetical protein